MSEAQQSARQAVQVQGPLPFSCRAAFSKVLQSLPALRIMQYQRLDAQPSAVGPRCSPLSTADGIQRQFQAAGRFASNALDAQEGLRP